MGKRVLIVDDEKLIVKGIRYSLEQDSMEVDAAYDGEEAMALIRENPYDMILLDVMLPKYDGFEVCRYVREFSDVPIIMLTARAEEVDKVLGLEFGADDYVTKPFGVRELMARVKANLRKAAFRAEPAADAPVAGSAFERLDLNPDRYEVRKDGKIIDLTLREFELLKFLSGQKGQVFSRETLLEKVWGYEYFGDVRTVDVTIRRLREKIEDDPGKPVYILTKRGVGYYFDC